MKRNTLLLLLVAGAVLSLGVAWKAIPTASTNVAASSRLESRSEPLTQPGRPVTPAKTPPREIAKELAIAAVETAVASQNRDRQIAAEIESALVSKDAGRRETAFAVLLPELLRTDPTRVVDMVARQAGEERHALRDEVARQWITRDTESAVAWLESLGEERAAGVPIAVSALAAVSPAQAIDVADRLGVGRDDGSVEHILQIWAAESPAEARRWLENQPENARTAQLRARLPR